MTSRELLSTVWASELHWQTPTMVPTSVALVHSAKVTKMLVLAAWLTLVAFPGFTDSQRNDHGSIQDTSGLFPVVFNLATRALIHSNGTCGLQRPEVFCKLVEHVQIFPAENRHCDICDNNSQNDLQRHPINNAIDGSNRWWQSSTLTNGDQFNYVTITLDLQAIYQVAYVIVKAANSPRPGNWILERSVDGITYRPWMYFAMHDEDCWRLYKVRATVGVPTSLGDDQVICTSRYSKLDPLENGEIFVSIVNGRPGVYQPSRVLLDFTTARYVRLRLQKIRTLNADLMAFQQYRIKDMDSSVTRRYYYSIKDISIGGQCICYGHAGYCRRHDTLPDRFQCQCQHNTGGDNCEECLPLYNNKPWSTGGSIGCEECNCHGKASECVYNATVDKLGLSLNMEGRYSGGGFCQNCREFTTGLNCEKCIEGYYRPKGYSPSAPSPCRPCNCQETFASRSQCVQDDSRLDEGLNPGDCMCKPGFGGRSCQECAFGYHSYPNCCPCPCDPAGSRDLSSCEKPCRCKANVNGQDCRRCKPGFYNLDKANPNGCTECFCFGVTKSCHSALWGLAQICELAGWALSTLENGGLTLLPRYFDGGLEAKTYLLNEPNVNVYIDTSSVTYTPNSDVHYWVAPMVYLGNRISSYGGHLKYTIKFTLDGSLSQRFYRHLADPDVILKGSNMTIAHGRSYKRENQDNVMSVKLMEEGWYHLENNQPVTRRDFMTVLFSLQQLLIKATYHTAQDTIYLHDISLDVASPLVMTNHTLASVEQCQCPEGYAGLSCESCSPGWRREFNQLYGGRCLRCNCHSHATDCDPYTGVCKECKHNTVGVSCEKCLPGFYGDPRRGMEGDCKLCACPLISGNNFFAESCVARPTPQDRDAYECVNCQLGFAGSHCERCAPGYYGNPLQPGGMCRKCMCGGNIDHSIPGSCDSITGACKICANNTEGDYCERCKHGFYGSAVSGDCRPCSCNQQGSTSNICDQRIGQCQCRPHFFGRHCDRCQTGYGDISQGCVPCSCNATGSASYSCDAVTGQCQCRSGVSGQRCDQCAEGYFGLSQRGCQRCDCYEPGTIVGRQCDIFSGRCQCKPFVSGLRCDQCQAGYYGVTSGQGCNACDCHLTGSRSRQCQGQTGQCPCHHGVGGRTCTQCQPGYYGFSTTGCKQCKPCTSPGHICDPETGECVCPPNTEGPHCQRCKNGSYDFDSIRGCKWCNCTRDGSVSQQCNAVSGKCTCLPGFQGFSCNLCLHGYYGFPKCGACLCDAHGSDPASCIAGPDLCSCDDSGRCICKANVVGDRCDRCAPGTFSLQAGNPNGCTECYCFHRSRQCSQALYIWSQVTMPVTRLTISTQAVQRVKAVSGYLVITDSHVSVDPALRSRSLYWSLPNQFLGDKTTSYSGRLDFIHYFDGPRAGNSSYIISPLVVIQGNGFELHADVTMVEPGHAKTFTIRFHESYWRQPGQQPPVSRRLLMVALQNLTAVLIRATQDGQATYAEIGPISMEVAVPAQSKNDSKYLAFGVEQCKCPERYSGLSCQNPAPGYYRVRPDSGVDYSTPETSIGHVRPCQCHAHSNVCHPETGVCFNCQHNTTGDHCNLCAPGFYGIATRGSPSDCMPCACPLPDSSNNFSPTCMGFGNGLMCINCSEGYTGPRCEQCAQGYYGNPSKLGDKCQMCNCAPEGAEDDLCDIVTGQCRCRPGIQGRRCDECADLSLGVQDGVCISCYEGCTGMLLEDLKNLSIPSAYVNASGVVYPWEQLYSIKNQTVELKNKLDALRSTSLEGLNNMKNTITFQKGVADMLYDRAVVICGTEMNFTNSKVHSVQIKTSETLQNATAIEAIINELIKEIKGNISSLHDLVEKLINKQTRLNLTEALKEAKRILEVILNRDFADADNAAEEEGWKAENVSVRIKILTEKINDVSNITIALADLRNVLNDLLSKSQESRTKAVRFLDEELPRIGDLIARLQDKIEDIKEMSGESGNLIKEGTYFIDEAKKALERFQENIRVIEGRLSALTLALEDLNRLIDSMRDAMPNLEKLYEDSWRHAQELEGSAQQLKDLFDKVRILAEDPMRAARAYQSIVEAINQSETAVRNAQKTVQDIVNLANLDGLEEEVKRSNERSRRLLAQAEQLLDTGVQDLAAKLQAMKRELEKAEAEHANAEDILAMLQDGLDDLPQGFGDRLRTILRKADIVVEQAERANITVSNIGYRIDTELMPKIRQLQDFDINSVILNVDNNIKSVRQEASFITTNLQSTKEGSQRNFRDYLALASNISELRRKIDEARNLTNSMKLSLSGDGSCARSYRSELGPGVTNEVQLAVKLSNATNQDMLVLLVQKTAMEYLAVEITAENKVRYTWDAGKGSGTVTHPLVLQGDFMAQKDEAEKWYGIQAKRVGQIGLLKVWPVKKRQEDASDVSNRSQPGISLINFNSETSIFLAGVEQEKVPAGITNNKLHGCVGDVVLDGKPLGVFNFKTSNSQCRGCNNVPQHEVASSNVVFSFNGQGYAAYKISQLGNYNNKIFTINLEFKTFWEDSGLFFAGNPQNNDFVSIDLVGGKLLVAFDVGGPTGKASVESQNVYNTNQWVKVIVERRGIKGFLTTSILMDQNTPMEKLGFSAAGSNEGLEIIGQDLYIGGLPNTYPIEKFPNATLHAKNFLGCMRNMAFAGSSNPQPLTEGLLVGVSPGCKDSEIRQVGFYGDGYVVFDGIPLRGSKAVIGLSFYTKQPDGLLLLSRDSSDSYYSLALIGGKLEAKFSAGSQPTVLKSPQTYNDGVVHYVVLMKDARQLEMLVDDVKVDNAQLPLGVSEIPMGNTSDLFFGGVPNPRNGMAATSTSLNGCIGDVIADEKPLDMSKAKQYKRANIGHCGPSDVKTNGVNPAPMCDASVQASTVTAFSSGINRVVPVLPPADMNPAPTATPRLTMACSPFRLMNAGIEENAKTLGNSDHSYALIQNLPVKDLQKRFNITFEFRTFFKDGLFGLLKNADASSYFVAQLKDGKVEAVFTLNNVVKRLASREDLADGRWHSSQIIKDLSRLQIFVDGVSVGLQTINATMDFEQPLYIGGLSTKGPTSVPMVDHSLRGCVRNLHLNGLAVDIIDTDVISGVEHCYVSVEPGVGFAKDSFGAYDHEFTVGSSLTVEAEFKSSERDGILFVIHKRGVQLSLELLNGKVVFSLINQDDPVKVESSNIDPNRYCSYQWHTVRATLSREQLRLKVDDGQEIVKQGRTTSPETPLQADFYIGGFPSYLSRTLGLSGRGLYGCMRSFTINGQSVDWYSLPSAENILRTACPL